MKNKIKKVKDFVVDHDIDILAITETWLQPGNIDEVDIGTLCPIGYRFFHVPRSYSLGGGVGLLFKETINVNSQITDTFESFEYMNARLCCLQGIRILVIYRPPGRSSYDLFYEEFSKLIEQTAVSPGGLLIVGDFNLHVDDGDNFQARRFVDILESYNLRQHVTRATHISGHTLDLAITKSNDAFLSGISIFDPVISDHSAVKINLLLRKPQFKKETRNYRKLRSIEYDALCDDINNSALIEEPSSHLDILVYQYDNVLRSLLDRHAPIKQRGVTVRPSSPWYSTEIAQNKRIRRKLERKWRSTLLPSDCELYVHQCSVVNNLTDSAKSSYHTTVISDFSGDQRMLFKTVNKLLPKQKVQQYPSCFPDSTSLADAFNNFFISKIDKIHIAFTERAPENDLSSSHTTERPLCDVQIHNFQQVPLDMVKKFAVKTLTNHVTLIHF